MPFVNLNTVTVDCRLVEIDGGAPESGTVTFISPQVLFDVAGGQVITPTPIQRSLDGSGDQMMTIPCSDDPDVRTLDMQPWTYTVVISTNGAPRATYPNVTVPVALAGTTLNLVPLLLGTSATPEDLTYHAVYTATY